MKNITIKSIDEWATWYFSYNGKETLYNSFMSGCEPLTERLNTTNKYFAVVDKLPINLIQEQYDKHVLTELTNNDFLTIKEIPENTKIKWGISKFYEVSLSVTIKADTLDDVYTKLELPRDYPYLIVEKKDEG